MQPEKDPTKDAKFQGVVQHFLKTPHKPPKDKDNKTNGQGK
jgi:hypothetical protein